MKKTISVFILVIMAVTSAAVFAGGVLPQAENPPLAFEVASIKPNIPDGSGQMRMGIQPLPGGRLNVTNASLKMLIRFAYNIDDAQISGGPSWLDSDRYDIVAKGEGNATTDQLRQMLQSLLADRFQLKFHHDSKELPVYALLAARNGPKLKPAAEDAPVVGARGAAVGGRGAIMMMRGGAMTQIAGNMSMDQLSQALANLLGRKVVNKTGLDGFYEIKLEWTPQPGEGPVMMMPGMPPGGGDRGDRGAPPAADPSGSSIFSAVQEQLGLRLESQKGPIDVIVIDSAAKPKED
jgi:bla regulator protein blaR1